MVRKFTLFILLLSSASVFAGESDKSAKPNILFILTDDMGWGDLGTYGSKQVKTPNIDALAKRGAKFTQAYVSANVCAPSRAGILTGRYQERFGFEHNLTTAEQTKPEKVGIPLDEKLISDRLKTLGYQTGIIGKWHVGESAPGHHPLSRGFDFYFGMLGGWHDYFPTAEVNELSWNREKITKVRTPYLTDWFTLEAMDYIDRSEKKDEPWFLYLSYNTPHSPLQAKQKDLDAYAHVKNEQRRTYCAMQKSLDDNVGKLLAHLKAKGLDKNTIIVFLNDNGGSVEVSHAVNAPFRGSKGTWLEGGIRVPMIFSWPGKIKEGVVYEEPVISFDVMHTLVNVAGGTVEEEKVTIKEKEYLRPHDGVNLLPYLEGKKTGRPHETLYWRMTLRGGAIREGDWKLIMTPHHPPMLFDLKNDASELNNQASQKPEKLKALYEKYHNWCESFERNPMWISSNAYAAYNDDLYNLKYDLKQPEE